ncbi:MAG: hypothetical protein Q7V56_07290 [Gammaproteobacteria bacterium]|nr:hypothetical protein [Gammaproteobacteria bacterium]
MNNGFVKIVMASGNVHEISDVLLFPELELEQILKLKAQAQENLGGFSSGIGFLGSPGWVFGGVAALGLFESVISNSKIKKGLGLLKEASEKFEEFRKRGKLVPISEIEGIEFPNPSSWHSIQKAKIKIDLKPMGMLEKGEFAGKHKIGRNQIQNGVAEFEATTPFVQFESDFIVVRAAGELRSIRWSSIECYESFIPALSLRANRL